MVTDITMITCMCDHIRLDRIINEIIREKVGVVPIENKMRKTRLRQFGHINRRNINGPVWIYERNDLLNYKRESSKLKKNWNELIRYNLRHLRLIEYLAQDRKFVLIVSCLC